MTRPTTRYVAADPAASMLELMREDTEGVVMHQLARGSVDSSVSGASGSPQGSWPLDTPGPSRGSDGRPLPVHLRPLQSIGIIELLEQDDRPTLIVDLSDPANSDPAGQLSYMFSNAAMRASDLILNLLSPDTSRDIAVGIEFDRFKTWVLSQPKDSSPRPKDVFVPSISYGGVTWTSSTLRKKYRVISAHGVTTTLTPTASPSQLQVVNAVLDERNRGPNPEMDPNTPREHALDEEDYFGPLSEPRQDKMPQSDEEIGETESAEAGLHMAETSGELAQPSFDWTRIALHQGLPQHILFARSIDWAATPLGPIEHWPENLRTVSSLVMGSPNPAAMYWGREYTAIYNEAYTKLAAAKHPMMMGNSYKVVFSEIWDIIEPVFDSAWNRGQSTMKNDDRLFLIRNGFLEETYFNWAIIPLVGPDGNVTALFNPAFDNTSRKVNERRMLTLREIGTQTSPATDTKSFWSLVLKAFEYNEFDIPFIMIYSTTPDEPESDISSLRSGSYASPPTVVLEGALGVPGDHPSAASRLDLRESSEGFAPYMRESMSHGGQPIVLNTSELPSNLVSNFVWRGFGDPCSTIVVFPVHPTPSVDAVAGFIVMGTNPRRPYNKEYELFIQLVSRQLATSMAAVALFEEEIRKGQRAARIAALDRQELSLQLRLRTQEAVESEYKFSRFAEFAPVGMFITNNVGKITYCSDTFWQLSRHPRSHDTINTWMQSVRDEDRSALEAAWEQLVGERAAVTHEFRFKTSSQADGHTVDTWVLLSAFPEKDGAGDLKRIFGCLTDISNQKWAETFQRQRREEAVELKRQQENFIDITSHELRNPLSAILQCADEITNGLSRFRDIGIGAYSEADVHLLLGGCIEAANTISLCASHQKRIVDDTLTFSKLDSQLITVTPVDSQPVSTVEDVIKMFESEIRSNDINLEFRIEQSFEELGVDWVKMDPSRLRQVLINLMANAIKFTSNAPERPCIRISLGASRDHGDGLPPSRHDYFPSRSNAAGGLTDGPEWSTGEKILLHLAVTDTGPGLDHQEKKLLFQRFSQASPRTHVQYGGFGLGLYICRTLSELQGGQISVVSEKGVGSTFAFYIKARKVDAASKQSTSPRLTLPRPSPFSSGVTGPDTADAGGSLSADLNTLAPSIETPSPQLSTATAPPAYQIRDTVAIRTSSSPVLAGATHGQTMQPLDVLIVEDNVVNQRVLQRQLIQCGNNTVVANHGKEALAALRRSRYWRSPPPPSPRDEVAGQERPQLDVAVSKSDESILTASSSSTTASRMGTSTSWSKDGSVSGDLETDINISIILMDLEMPIMDGITCARRIRELERQGIIAHHIPIIAVTAYARPEQIETAKSAGIDDVISKPFRIPELIPKIEELVTKYNTQRISPETPKPPLASTLAATAAA